MKYAFALGALVLGFCMSAPSVHAQIRINEVAWMGTDSGGANCEWVELYNESDDIVDLSSWTLRIENAGGATAKDLLLGETASVKYGGIAGRGYYLIARNSGTCGNEFPGEEADWLGSFGSGISNSGAKITLLSGTNEEDVLDSRVGWEVSKGGAGGKNTSPKETPQWTGSAWLTASPTPRGQNHTAPLPELKEDESVTTPPVVTVGGTAPLVPVTHPVPKLYVDGGPARIVIAGAHTPFSALAYDSTGMRHKNADITWSFGEGGSKKGEEVSYAYREPGEYTVVVRARSKGVSAVSFISVVAVASPISISHADGESITLRNDSDDFVDLSFWKIGDAKRAPTLPADTVLAPYANMRFAYETLAHGTVDEPSLRFPNGMRAVSYTQPLETEESIHIVRDTEVTPVAFYEEELVAPAGDQEGTPAGAPLPTEESKVVLKEERSIGNFFRSLVASVASIVVP